MVIVKEVAHSLCVLMAHLRSGVTVLVYSQIRTATSKTNLNYVLLSCVEVHLLINDIKKLSETKKWFKFTHTSCFVDHPEQALRSIPRDEAVNVRRRDGWKDYLILLSCNPGKYFTQLIFQVHDHNYSEK